jgi:hypothetical protein
LAGIPHKNENTDESARPPKCTTQHNTTRDYEILIRADPDNWQSMLNMHSAKRSKPNKEDNPSQKD